MKGRMSTYFWGSIFLLATPALNANCLGIAHLQGGLRYDVEIAASPREHERGLMFRKTLANDAGMLFLFENESQHHFWMKNTYIPLDILFYDLEGALRDVAARAIPLDETPLPGFGALVLEVNADQYTQNPQKFSQLRFELEDETACAASVRDHPLRIWGL